MFLRSSATAAARSPSSAAVAVKPGATPGATRRLCVRGKFLFEDDAKFPIRGVTYGPFQPDERGCKYHHPEIVRRDFLDMSLHGMNAVRTYTRPPRWLLDIAAERNLKVLIGVGLAGEQLSAFLDDPKLSRTVLDRCESDVAACADHPAVLGYAIGNEIPAPIVRWHGRRRVEVFLERMYGLAKAADPQGLVTYVNFPTTEYLQTPFVDFHSFNVYLEDRRTLEKYLGRLQNIADEKPLVMAEIGLDTLRNGEAAQAEILDWQVRTSLASGCAGAFIFAWTDEWHTGGSAVQDWKFGLTDEQRKPKPALAAVRSAFADGVGAPAEALPRFSVVVCSYNGARNIGRTLSALRELDYPDFEVIVVDDGSTDGTSDIAATVDGIRLIRTRNCGLSHARNVGMRAASGELIAYVDDDAWPDRQWLRYLAHGFRSGGYAGVGGPNIVPEDDPCVAQCVANSPGGPTHVLLTDSVAEHIPGCNMAFRTDRLREIGGFDEQYTIAGDDVDVCWRLQEAGHTLGFSPAALVWHRRRNTVRGYLKQQYNYGRAEGMLEAKWPQKYNSLGHVAWHGRLYGTGSLRGVGLWRSRIYHGVWSCEPFQSLYTPNTHLGALPLMPEWYLAMACLVLLSIMGFSWPPLGGAAVVAALMLTLTTVQSLRSACRASFTAPTTSRALRIRMRALTTTLHLLQPMARLAGRLSCGLTPWRRRTDSPLALPLPGRRAAWSEVWQSSDQRLRTVEKLLLKRGAHITRGHGFAEWDLEVRGGIFAAMRMRMAIEEYPGGRQLVRFGYWPRLSYLAIVLAAMLAALAVTAAMVDSAPVAAAVLGAFSLGLIVRTLVDAALASGCLRNAIQAYSTELEERTATALPPENAIDADDDDEVTVAFAEAGEA